MCWTASAWALPRRCEMEFRNVRIKDIENVRELEVSLIREYFSATLENKWEDLPQDWKDGLGASSPRHFKAYLDSGLSFVAEEDGEIVGFIFAQMLHHICDEDNLLWIENMGVHPYFRRNEIGYRLLRECVLKGREMGATVAHSMIQPDNAPSILLHKKIGFFIDRRDVALLDLRDPKLRLRRGSAGVGQTSFLLQRAFGPASFPTTASVFAIVCPIPWSSCRPGDATQHCMQ